MLLRELDDLPKLGQLPRKCGRFLVANEDVATARACLDEAETLAWRSLREALGNLADGETSAT